jgi:probable rRNA maturation factor
MVNTSRPAVDVFVANEQSDVEVDERRLIALARFAAAEEGIDPRAELSVLLVDRGAMASLKERWVGESGPTDVLAFPMDEDVGEDEPFMIGDVVICPDVAREQAETRSAPANEEVDLLLVHGILHLVGYDHVRAADAKAMKHRERRILQGFSKRETP